jgi:hypothetical protein
MQQEALLSRKNAAEEPAVDVVVSLFLIVKRI